MRIALLDTKRTMRAAYMLEAFKAGAAAHGDTCVFVTEQNHAEVLPTIDVAAQIAMVNWQVGEGPVKPVNEFRRRVWATLEALGKRTLVIDTGFFSNQYAWVARRPGRRVNFHIDKPATYAAADRFIYYEMAYDGIKGRGDHCCSPHVAQDRWLKLQQTMLPWRNTGQKVLFLSQPLHGQSSQDIDIFAWYRTVLSEVRRCTMSPVHVRIHPRVLKDTRACNEYKKRFLKAAGAGAVVTWSRQADLAADLLQARLAVAYSTNAAIQAVLSGVPTFVGSPACMAWPMRSPTLAAALTAAASIKHPPRTAWVAQLAYSQWNIAEMRSGAAWAHYRPHATKPPINVGWGRPALAQNE